MTQPLTTSAFAAEASISIGYASDMLNGKRPMPRPLAIHIFRKTGWKHESIAALSEQQITTLEQIEPWIAPAARARQSGAAA